MLRVIIKTKNVCHISGVDKESYQTFDFNNDQLEQILTE